jgi:hypothetical protein
MEHAEDLIKIKIKNSVGPVAPLTAARHVPAQNHDTRILADILARTGLQEVISVC